MYLFLFLPFCKDTKEKNAIQSRDPVTDPLPPLDLRVTGGEDFCAEVNEPVQMFTVLIGSNHCKLGLFL